MRVSWDDVAAGRRVCVSGEVDLANVALVLDAVIGALADDPDVVLLDLSDTTYLDSAGIAMVFRLGQRMTHRRQTLALVVPSHAPIRAVLELTRMRDLIPIHETLVAAAAALRDGTPDGAPHDVVDARSEETQR